jgi:sugar/nucleoside kinase (ribokinase family)
MRPAFLTSLGQDAEGDELVATLSAQGIDCAHTWRDPARATDTYMAIEDSLGLVAAIADAHSLEAAGDLILSPLSDGRLGSAAAPWAGPIVIDGNLTEDLLAGIAASPLFARAQVTAVPASPGKALRLRPMIGMANATLHLNRIEADALAGRASADAADAARAILGLGAARVIVTDGANLSADGTADGIVTARPPAVPIRRITGAGDTCLAAHLVAERRGMDRAAALAAAVRTAARHVAGEDPHEPA